MEKGQRIEFKKDAKIMNVQIKAGDQWEVMLETSEKGNAILVKVGKKGKALNPYKDGNMIGLTEFAKRAIGENNAAVLI